MCFGTAGIIAVVDNGGGHILDIAVNMDVYLIAVGIKTVEAVGSLHLDRVPDDLIIQTGQVKGFLHGGDGIGIGCNQIADGNAVHIGGDIAKSDLAVLGHQAPAGRAQSTGHAVLISVGAGNGGGEIVGSAQIGVALRGCQLGIYNEILYGNFGCFRGIGRGSRGADIVEVNDHGGGAFILAVREVNVRVIIALRFVKGIALSVIGERRCGLNRDGIICDLINSAALGVGFFFIQYVVRNDLIEIVVHSGRTENSHIQTGTAGAGIVAMYQVVIGIGEIAVLLSVHFIPDGYGSHAQIAAVGIIIADVVVALLAGQLKAPLSLARTAGRGAAAAECFSAAVAKGDDHCGITGNSHMIDAIFLTDIYVVNVEIGSPISAGTVPAAGTLPTAFCQSGDRQHTDHENQDEEESQSFFRGLKHSPFSFYWYNLAEISLGLQWRCRSASKAPARYERGVPSGRQSR